MQAIEKDNFKLRQDLAKASGVDPSKIRGGRKVCSLRLLYLFGAVV